MTLNVSYAPSVTYMSQLIEKTKMLLVDNDKKKEVVDFCVPCLSWVYLKSLPSYDNIKTEERYFVVVVFLATGSCSVTKL